MRRRLDEFAPGMGPAAIPYTRNAQEDPLMGMLSPEQQAAAAASIQPVQDEADEPGLPASEAAFPPMGGAPTGLPPAPGASGAPMSDQLPNEALAGMVDPNTDPQVAQVIAAMEDPNLDPNMRGQIDTMLALAARRRMAGL